MLRMQMLKPGLLCQTPGVFPIDLQLLILQEGVLDSLSPRCIQCYVSRSAREKLQIILGSATYKVAP